MRERERFGGVRSLYFKVIGRGGERERLGGVRSLWFILIGRGGEREKGFVGLGLYGSWQ